MTNTRVLFLLAAGGLGAAACTERSQPIAPSLNADFATRGISDPAAAFIPAYDAGTSVHVVDSLATQSEDTATVQAIGDWNQAWQPSAHEAVLSMDAGDYLLVVKFDSDGAYYCGDSEDGYAHILRTNADCDGCGGDACVGSGELKSLLVHEIGHALGYRHLDSFDATYECAMDVPLSGPLNGICVQEQQLAFWKYGDRDSVNLEVAMITGVNLSVSPIAIEDTIWVRPTYTMTPSTPAVSGPHDAPTWSIDDSSIAAIVDQAGDSVQIAALIGGSTTLRVELEPDRHVIWDPSGPLNAAAMISVTGGPDACFGVESASTWQATDQYLNAGCSDQGANIRYSWRFEDGGDWTSPSADTLYDFEGHASTGQAMVSLKVTNISTGLASITSTGVSVSSGSMSVWGDDGIPVKTTYVYLSNHDGHWWERYPPSLGWTEQVDWYTDSIARIWPGGEYTVDLRAQDGRYSVLRRGKLPITVCTVTQSCGSQRLAQAPGKDGALFGGGPVLAWIEAGKPQALQFYQLMGAHTGPSPFTSNTWFNEMGGSARNTPWPGSVAWRRAESDGVIAWDFHVEPPTAGEYVFGFALDPDLGVSAADDASAYDPVSRTVYVSDATKAVGFLLRSEGRDAMATVVQYGTKRFAPVSASRTWEAARQGGVNLLTGNSDVQFLLGSSPMSGRGHYTLLMVEAANVAALVAKARAIR